MVVTESIKIIKTTKKYIHFTKIEESAQAKAIYDKIKKSFGEKDWILSNTKNIENCKWKK
jgi:hypothetical protein